MASDVWSARACVLESGPRTGIALGLVALAGDAVVEREVRLFAGASADVFTTRLSVDSELGASGDVQVGRSIVAAAKLLLPGARLDVAALGCTSLALHLGSESICRLIRSVRPNVAVTDPLRAIVRTLCDHGIGNIALVTPYSDTINASLEAFFVERNVSVVSGVALRSAAAEKAIGRSIPNAVDPASILEAIVDLRRCSAGAIVVACTGLRCSTILDEAQAIVGRPVVCSNEALADHALTLASRPPGSLVSSDTRVAQVKRSCESPAK